MLPFGEFDRWKYTSFVTLRLYVSLKKWDTFQGTNRSHLWKSTTFGDTIYALDTCGWPGRHAIFTIELPCKSKESSLLNCWCFDHLCYLVILVYGALITPKCHQTNPPPMTQRAFSEAKQLRATCCRVVGYASAATFSSTTLKWPDKVAG